MKKIKIAYVAYVVYLLLLLGVCILCMINVFDKDMVIIADILILAVIFLFCSNIFYVPRNMDNSIFLENKQKMKSDPILWREMLVLEIPLVVALLALVYLIK